MRLETSGADFVYTFLNAGLQNIHSQSLVRCCRKSQRHTEASALQDSRALPSDLTRDNVYVVMMLFAPATVQGGQSYSGAVLWNSLPTNLKQVQTLASIKSNCRGFLFDNE